MRYLLLFCFPLMTYFSFSLTQDMMFELLADDIEETSLFWGSLKQVVSAITGLGVFRAALVRK